MERRYSAVQPVERRALASCLPFPEEEYETLLSLFFLALLLLADRAMACDLCGCYPPQLETLSSADGLPSGRSWSWLSGAYGAVAEQFTHFGTLQMDSH